MSQYSMPRGEDDPFPPPGGSTGDAAKEQASAVAGDVKAQSQQVASHAAQETRQLADQAKNEMSELLWRSRSELSQQATSQQQRLAAGLRSLGEEIDEMTGASQRQGLAGQTAAQLSGRISEAADFLEQRDFQGVLDELTSFARRRPGAFLLGAALVGVVAGRVTRGLQSASSEPSTSEPPAPLADLGDGTVGVPTTAAPVAGLATDSPWYPAHRGLDEPVEGVSETPPVSTSAYTGLEKPRDEEYTATAEVTEPPPSGFEPMPESGEERGR